MYLQREASRLQSQVDEFKSREDKLKSKYEQAVSLLQARLEMSQSQCGLYRNKMHQIHGKLPAASSTATTTTTTTAGAAGFPSGSPSSSSSSSSSVMEMHLSTPSRDILQWQGDLHEVSTAMKAIRSKADEIYKCAEEEGFLMLAASSSSSSPSLDGTNVNQKLQAMSERLKMAFSLVQEQDKLLHDGSLIRFVTFFYCRFMLI